MNSPSIEQERPIIILGCPKSGTTLLRLILDSHPNISCGPETAFLVDMHAIVSKHWSHMELYRFEKDYWFRKIEEFYSSFQMDYVQRRGKKRWAEKTPIYTEYTDFLLTLFPNAQFIHLIRDGRDVAYSMKDRHGWYSAVRCMRKSWRSYIQEAQKLGKKLPKNQFLEIRYESLVSKPEETTQALFKYLNETWQPEVLDYNKHEHDIKPTFNQYNKERMQSNHWDGKTIYKHRVGAWKRRFDIVLMLIFYTFNWRFLRKLGY